MEQIEHAEAHALGVAERKRWAITENHESAARAALEHRGYRVKARPHGDALLSGSRAMLDPEAETVWHADEGAGVNALLLAHELGHLVLHGGKGSNVATYSPHETREKEAEAFARGFTSG